MLCIISNKVELCLWIGGCVVLYTAVLASHKVGDMVVMWSLFGPTVLVTVLVIMRAISMLDEKKR